MSVKFIEHHIQTLELFGSAAACTTLGYLGVARQAILTACLGGAPNLEGIQEQAYWALTPGSGRVPHCPSSIAEGADLYAAYVVLLTQHPPAEAELFLHMLRVAYGPVQKDALIRSIRDGQTAGDLQQMARAHLDAEAAIRFLKRRGDIRALALQDGLNGWVLNERGLTDDEWRARFRNPAGEGAPPLWRYATPPEAFVTVVGGPSDKMGG